MIDNDPLIAARLSALVPTNDDSDWHDVLLRAARLRRSPTRLGRKLTMILATAVFLGVVTPAIAFRHQLVHLFSGTTPAPVPVRHAFASLDRGAPPGMAPHVRAGLARVVLRRPLGHGDTAITWAAPTEQGGFCTQTAVATPTDPDPTGGGGGCDAKRTLRLAPQIEASGPITITGGGTEDTAIHGVVLFSGDTLIPAAASIELTYQDGDHTSIPLTWISKPINAAFFAYAIPPRHYRLGHAPTVIQVKDANGRVLLTDRTFFKHGLLQLGSR